MIEFEEYNKPLPMTIKFFVTNATLKILQQNHIGKSKAIKATELSEIVQCLIDQDVDVRKLRQAISALRLKGQPVCSCSKGYYFVDEATEFESTIQSLTERMKALAAEIAALMLKYREMYGAYALIDFDDLAENIDTILYPPEVEEYRCGED